MSVTIIQPGSRRRYFIPRLLQERGMLELFATDFTTHSWLGRILKNKGLIKRPILSEIPREKIVSADVSVLLRDIIDRYVFKQNGLQYHLKTSKMIANKLKKRGLGRTDTLYCMNIGFADYLEFIKERSSNVRIICDVFMHPRTDYILKTASTKFPEWPIHLPRAEDVVMRDRLFIRTAGVADVLLCPSEWVAQGVREIVPKYADKIRVCPYGSSIDYGDRSNTPVRGRFFWAGTEPLGKGLPYLARAASTLKPKYPNMDFRVAGITDKRIIEMPECKNLHFLGRLNKTQMQEEYLSADAFVFPTLSEGLAGVLVESIAGGCPVITTRCGGLNLEKHKAGILIPEHDEPALINALERVYNDRVLRIKIAANTSELAHQYSIEAWGERLMLLINEIS